MTNRQRYPMVDNVASLSQILSWTEDAAGKTWHVTTSLQTRVLDGRDMDALFATFDDYKLFAPLGVRLELLGVDLEPTGGPLAQASNPVDPTQDVRYTLQFLLHIPSDVGAQSNVLLAVFGHMQATGAPEPTAWPEVAETVGAPITMTTAGGTPVECNVKEVEVATGGGVTDIDAVLDAILLDANGEPMADKSGRVLRAA